MKINSPFNFSLWNEDLANTGFKSGAHTARLPRSKYMQPAFFADVDNETNTQSSTMVFHENQRLYFFG